MSEAIGGGRTAPLGVALLLTEALRRVGEAPVRFALLWGVWGAAFVGVQMAADAAKVSLVTPSLSPGFIGGILALSVGGGVSGAAAVRLALEGPKRWLRVDRRFAECAGLLTVGLLVPYADNALIIGGAQPGGAPELRLVLVILGLISYAALFFVFSKLLLWPIGRLTGRTEVTPARSWGLMRGALRSWLLANLLTAIPLAAVVLIESMAFGTGAAEAPAVIVISGFAGQAYSIIGQVMSAVIFAHRVDASANLAAVFD